MKKTAIKRKKKVRAKLSANKRRHRLSVFRSINQIYAQIVDPNEGKTIVAADSSKIEKSKPSEMSKNLFNAYQTGLLIAKKAKEKQIEEVVFDRGQYAYHGRVKALAEGARKGGLKF